MIESEKELLKFLQQHGILYQRIEHPPVFTCDEAERYRPRFSSVSTKNLFLEDKHSNPFLLMTDCEKRTDLKTLGAQIGATKLHLASEARLWELLGVNRGAVTILGLINDIHKKVQVLIDKDIWQMEYYLCHPLVNTATLVLSRKDLENYITTSGHHINLVFIPTRK